MNSGGSNDLNRIKIEPLKAEMILKENTCQEDAWKCRKTWLWTKSENTWTVVGPWVIPGEIFGKMRKCKN